MSMDMFRRKQKHIFWVITIVVIIAFVFWGNYRFGTHETVNADIAVVNDKKVDLHEFQRFRSSLQAAAGLPISVQGVPANETIPGLWDYLWCYMVVDEANKAGIDITDTMIGTYIRYQHPIISQVVKDNPDKLDDAVKSICMQSQISRSDFIQGVRDFLAIQAYVDNDKASTAPDDSMAYLLYALLNADMDFKILHVQPNAAMTEQAKKEIMEKPAEELDAAIRARIADSAADPRYRQPAKWRFSYVILPFDAVDDVKPPTDEEVEAFYNSHKSDLYQDKTLDEVKPAVVAELEKMEQKRMAMRNLNFDIDSQLRDHGSMEMSELAKLAKLVNHGVKTGDTGEKLLTAKELAASDAYGKSELLEVFLDDLDNISPASQKTAEQRQSVIDSWKSGFLLHEKPFETDMGLVRLRLVDYLPSQPLPVENADGAVNPQLYELALSDLVGARVAEMVNEKANNTVLDVTELLEARGKGETYEGEIAAEYDNLAPMTVAYRDLLGNPLLLGLGRMGVNEVRGPLGSAYNPQGLEIDVLTERRVPSRAAFAAEPADVKKHYIDMVRNIRVADIAPVFAGGGGSFVFLFKSSETMGADFWQKVRNGKISIADSFFRSQPQS